MPFDKESIENILERKTLSGLDPSEIEVCIKSHFDNYFEWWSYDAYDAMREKYSHKEMIEIIWEMDRHQCVGDFLADEVKQKIEIAAYLLILLDRFAKNAEGNFDIWTAINYFHQIYECIRYVSSSDDSLTRNAKKAAYVRHTENRAMKKEAFLWYEEHGVNLKNDAAAIEITKLVPIGLRTAQDWVTSFRKEIRSARTT